MKLFETLPMKLPARHQRSVRRTDQGRDSPLSSRELLGSADRERGA